MPRRPPVYSQQPYDNGDELIQLSPSPYTSSFSRPSMDERLPLGVTSGSASVTGVPRVPRQGGLAERYDSDTYLVSHAGGDNGGYSNGGYSPQPPMKVEEDQIPVHHGHRGDSAYAHGGGCVPSNPKKRRALFIGVPIAIIVIAAIVVGVVVGVTRHKSSGSSSGSSSSNDGAGAGASGSGTATSTSPYPTISASTGQGGDGSTVTTDTGETFTYSNSFGGFWQQDPNNPYSVSGQAQAFTPKLSEPWVWGEHIIRGVNLGGWLVTEPFIVPSLYEQYQNSTPQAVDEFTLSMAMDADLATKMEEHYATFITEKDIADIAAAGLNWVRIPLGFWAIATNAGEPYLERTSWTYFLRAIEWCRKYGIRILLDFHALPGSQNGWNHSGKQGSVNWMYGVMGIANAERSLEYLRTLVEFISQDGIKQVVPMIGLVNEVMAATVGQTVMGNFYYQAYEMIREITGIGSVNGPIIAIHEGFLGIAAWDSFLSGADRLALDQHPYQAFPTVQNNYGWEWQIANGCGWGGGTNDTQSGYGIVVGGEWSLAINDCGLWVNGVGTTPNYATAYGSCADFDQWMNYNDTMKQGLYNYAVGQMDSLQNWFFWTWKIGNSTVLGYPSAPQWHYQLGLQQGWIPKDPRVAGGWCKANGYCTGCAEFNGTFPVTATGAATSATIIPAQVSSYGAWPPTSMGPSLNSAEIAMLPTFTRTAQPTTLPMASPTFSAEGNGWYNAQDTKLAYTTVAGCPYPNAYNATAASVPTELCTGSAVARRAQITPAP